MADRAKGGGGKGEWERMGEEAEKSHYDEEEVLYMAQEQQRPLRG